MAEHNIIGERGEAIAIAYLRKKGYEIKAVNWRFQKAEIDVICFHENLIVIVEVKTRTSTEFENPKEAVTIPKQKRIVNAANHYIESSNIELECRFDIISVLILGKKVDVEHIEDAFSPQW